MVQQSADQLRRHAPPPELRPSVVSGGCGCHGAIHIGWSRRIDVRHNFVGEGIDDLERLTTGRNAELAVDEVRIWIARDLAPVGPSRGGRRVNDRHASGAPLGVTNTRYVSGRSAAANAWARSSSGNEPLSSGFKSTVPCAIDQTASRKSSWSWASDPLRITSL